MIPSHKINFTQPAQFFVANYQPGRSKVEMDGLINISKDLDIT